MTTPGAGGNGPPEVTGLGSAREYATGMVQAFTRAATGTQTFAAGLDGHGVDGHAVAAVARAQELTSAAASAWQQTSGALDKQTVVQEAYAVTPEAGDKHFLTDGAGAAGTTATDSGPPPTTSEHEDANVVPQLGDRDRLARSIYTAKWPGSWQLGQARAWDAGQAPAEFPDSVAAAYERADAVLAERAAAPTDRLDTMREHEVTSCPQWCRQDDDEHQYEEHAGPGRTFATDGGDEVTFHPRASWWDEGEPSIQMTVKPHPDGDGTITLTSADLAAMQRLSDEVMDTADEEHANPSEAKPAYPGADFDAIGADHPVASPAAAAAAIATQKRVGGYLLGNEDDDNAPSLDWATREVDGVRQLEAYDGTENASLTLTPAHMRDLRDGFGRLVGAVDDGVEDPGQLLLDDGGDGAYIDWSIVTQGGVRLVEFGDGIEVAAQLELTDDQLRDLHTLLAQQIEHDDQATAPR